MWCSNHREESLRLQVPTKFRVKGVVQSMPEFHSCKAGQPMAKANVCQVVW